MGYAGYGRWFLAVLCLIFFAASMIIKPAYAAQRHQCAASVPPSISPPLALPTATPGLLFINEVLFTPHTTWNCSHAGTAATVSDAWVELYNPQNQPFDLYAAHTTLDSGANSGLFFLPLGTAIAAHSFLVLFPCTYPHFVCTTTLRLLISGTVIDQVAVPPLAPDTSYARIPDGSLNWQATAMPTIATSNILTQIKASATATRAHKSAGTGSKNGGGSAGKPGATHASGGDTGSTSDPPPAATALQPTWNALSFPAGATMAVQATATTSGTISADPAPTSEADPFDVPRKVLLTLLATAFVLALVWCWRLFIKH